jgi:hypothetical protein
VALVFFAGSPVHVSPVYLAAHGFGTALCLALGELWMRTRFVTRELIGLSALGLAVFAFAYPRLTTTPPYAALAEAVRPHLGDAPAAYPSFLAQDSDILQGYLDRNGLNFEDVAQDPARAVHDSGLRAFVISPEESGRAPTRDLVDWLVGHAREVTPPGLAAPDGGKRSGSYRVFVR